MTGKYRQGKNNPLHFIMTSDRMTRLGYSVEEINAHIRQTPFDELVRANLEALEAKARARAPNLEAQEARERYELADAMQRWAAGPEYMRRDNEDPAER